MKALIRNKFRAVMAAAVVLMTSVCHFSEDVTALNTEQIYKVFDAQAGGAAIRTYTLSALAERDNSRVTIGSEDRVVDWTKSGVCKGITAFDSENRYTCFTGYVVGAHTIATAAHCLYDEEDRCPFVISDVLLFNSDGTVALEATPVESHVPVAFINETAVNGYDAAAMPVDYALLTVEEDLSDYMHFNLGVPLDTIDISATTVTIDGFPGVVNRVAVNDYNTHTLYSASGSIVDMTARPTSRCFEHEIDATEGQSGAPVYLTESRCGSTFYTVIGMHIADEKYYWENYALAFTTDMIHFYMNNGNLNW